MFERPDDFSVGAHIPVMVMCPKGGKDQRQDSTDGADLDQGHKPEIQQAVDLVVQFLQCIARRFMTKNRRRIGSKD